MSIGYSQATQRFELNLDDIGLTESEWFELTEDERNTILDETLDNELGNVLDTAIWVEGEEY